MKTFVTSDLHFGHKRIMEFCPVTRGHYRDITHMNTDMIARWNDVVDTGDLVYILGDVAFCSAPDAAKIFNQLNGSKILVAGNHDRKALKDYSFRSAFTSIHDYLEVRYNGTKIVMFHYPIAEFNEQHRGAVHFHGHLHQHESGLENFRVRNVGFDYTGNIVWNIEDAINDALKGEIKKHH